MFELKLRRLEQGVALGVATCEVFLCILHANSSMQEPATPKATCVWYDIDGMLCAR